MADIVLITGLSGAGRSAAAAVLEDLGWYVVDNLPTSLLPTIVELASKPGGGIDQLVTAQSPATHRAMLEALDAAQRAVDEIPRPFRTALLERSPEVQRAYDAVKTLQRLLATEVVAVLGATLKFNDNDGD